MRRRRLLSILVLSGLMLWAAGAVPAQDAGTGTEQGTPGEPFETAEGFLLNIKKADIAVLLELYSRLTGKAVLPDAQVSGKVNIINQARVSKAQAIAIVESVLELNGFSTVEGDRVIKVVPKRNAVKRNVFMGRVDEAEGVRAADRVETLLVVLRNIKAENGKSIITPLLSDVGNVTVDKDSNTLVLTEVASNSSRLVRILRELDLAPVKVAFQLRSYPVRYADVGEVVRQLQAYFKTRERGEDEPEPVFTEDRRLGAVHVTAVPAVHSEMGRILRVFDQAGPGKSAENLVVRLEYAKASSVATILQKLLGGDKAGGGGGSDGKERDVSIVADEATNTLIVSADRRRFAEINDLVRTLDVRNRQVLVKAIIMEVSLRDGRSLGVSWEYAKNESRVRSEMGSPLTTTTPFSAAQNALQGIKYAFYKPDEFTGFLNAIVTAVKVNILSSPHILTVDNKPAEIMVGQEVPYTKDSRVSDQQAVIKTSEYRKVGVKLKVTPRVTESRDVLMDIEEEISGLQGVDPDLDAPIFFTREAKATVIVRSGHTVVIGGLIKRQTETTTKKVPLLGDLPLIKHAFRYTDTSHDDTELIAFITPVVIDSDDTADIVTAETHEDFRTHIKDKGFQREIDDLFERVTGVSAEAQAEAAAAAAAAAGAPPAPVRVIDRMVVRRLDPPVEHDGPLPAEPRSPVGLPDKVRQVFEEYKQGRTQP